MIPHHHPEPAQLLDYAAGGAAEPVALLIASHLTLCPSCRREVASLDSLGGTLLEHAEPVPMSAGSLERLMDRIRRESASPERREDERADPSDGPFAPLPRPLHRYLPDGLQGLSWSSFAGGRLRVADLLPPRGSLRTRLLHVRAGCSILPHTHNGMEMSLILSGGYSDEFGQYLRGDVESTDETITHRPVADADSDCLVLSLTDADLRFVGPLGRILNPFIRS